MLAVAGLAGWLAAAAPLGGWSGAGALAAASLPAGLEAGERVVVREVVDGDTVRLADGRELRLIGIEAPKRPLARPADQPWPLAEQARAALAGLVGGGEAIPYFAGRRSDRHGLILAHLVDSQGRWLQAEMLALGLARVYTFADNRAGAADLLAIEDQARRARLGIWRDVHYRVVAADQARRFVDSFQLIEGRVLQAQTVGRSKLYLNFGPDWRTDFTVEIATAVRRELARRGIDAGALGGMRVRVRGWIKLHNGPAIDLTHSEQLEVLGP